MTAPYQILVTLPAYQGPLTCVAHNGAIAGPTVYLRNTTTDSIAPYCLLCAEWYAPIREYMQQFLPTGEIV